MGNVISWPSSSSTLSRAGAPTIAGVDRVPRMLRVSSIRLASIRAFGPLFSAYVLRLEMPSVSNRGGNRATVFHHIDRVHLCLLPFITQPQPAEFALTADGEQIERSTRDGKECTRRQKKGASFGIASFSAGDYCTILSLAQS